MQQVKLRVLLFCIVFRALSATDLDWVFMTQRSFSSAQLKGLGDAGAAMPGNIANGLMNPALFYTSTCNGNGAVALGYGRDSLFSRHIVPFAACYTSGKGSLGGYYRYQSGNDGIVQNEITINLSGQLFEKAQAQGAVDFGINFRYEWMDVERPMSRFLPLERYVIDSLEDTVFQSKIDSIEHSYQRTIDDRRLIADIGFYQPNIIEHIDFALVMRNVIGYTWRKERPDVTHSDSTVADSVSGTDTIGRITRTYEPMDQKHTTRGILAPKYRTIVLAAVYRAVISEKFIISFPIDLELLALFDRKVKTKFVFRGGIAVQIRSMFSARFGYSRQPKTIWEGLTKMENVNFFTGGIGVFFSPVSFDAYLSQGVFGMTAGYRF